MRDSKAIASFKDIYWDIRPRPDFGTLEFRICDMPATLALTFAIVALTRCLVSATLNLLKRFKKLALRPGAVLQIRIAGTAGDLKLGRWTVKSSKLAANNSERLTPEDLRKMLEDLNDEDLGRYKM